MTEESPLQDPDLCRALHDIRLSEGEDREQALLAVVSTLFVFSMPDAAREVLKEVPRDRRVLGWLLAVAHSCFRKEDVVAAFEAVEGYLPREAANEYEAAFIPSKEEIRSFLRVMRACVVQEWQEARQAFRDIRGESLSLDALQHIADASQLQEDQIALKNAVEKKQRKIDQGEDEDDFDLGTILVSSEPRRSLVLRAHLDMWCERLHGLMRRNAPADVLFLTVQKVAEAGDIKLAEATVQCYGMTLLADELVESFARGYALNGDFETARRYADQIPDALRRGCTYLQIFFFRMESRS